VQPLPGRAGRLHAGVGLGEGQVENQVGLVRERFFTPRLRFKNYDELNAWLLDKCVAYAKAHRHPEQPTARSGRCSRPSASFIPIAVASTASMRCRRRVEDLHGALRQQQILGAVEAVGRPVEIHAYADRIVIRQDGVSSASMPAASAAARRSTIPGTMCRCWPQARRLRNGAPFKDWVLPSAMEKVRRKLKAADDGDRQMVRS
jgi:hypothetical protein